MARHRLGKSPLGVLGAGEGREVGPAAEAAGRPQDDDVAAPPLDHVGYYLLTA